MDLKRLSIDEKVGQRFIFGINNTNIDCIVRLIRDNYIGGVVLYKKNYSSYNEMLSVIKKLKEANARNSVPLFMAIDQEGGRVNRFPDEVHVLKSVYDLSKKDDKLIKDSAKLTGKLLYNTGINMNLSPVMDVLVNSKSKVLYKRCFYGDDKAVVRNGKIYIKELNDNSVIAVAKHFPGHGATNVDSHLFIPYVYDYKKVLNNHIKVFEEIINDGVDALMLGHLVIRKLTHGLPVTMSRYFITKYLRQGYKYNGIIMTDEINMLRRHLRYRFNYLKKIFESGSDIFLVKIKSYDEGVKIINRYKSMIDNLELDESVKRIINMKDKYNVNDDIDFNGYDIDRLNEEIDDINNKVVY